MKQINKLFIIAAVFISPTLWAEDFSNWDIDMQIRASEDPNFDAYLREQEKQSLLEKNASSVFKEKREREKLQEEKARAQYAEYQKVQSKADIENQSFHYNKFQVQEKQRRLSEEENRKNYIAKKRSQEKSQQQHLYQQIAKMQSRLSRSPASVDLKVRPRSNKATRESRYKRILEKGKEVRFR